MSVLAEEMPLEYRLKAPRQGEPSAWGASEGDGASPAQNGARAEQASSKRAFRGPLVSRWATACSFVVPDAVTFMLVFALLSEMAAWTTFAGASTQWLFPVAGLIAAAFLLVGLYHRALTMHPVQEIRTAGTTLTVVFLVYGITLGLVGVVAPSELAGLGIAWALAILLLPLSRALSRILFSRANWWGAPVVVLASGSSGQSVVRTLKRWPEIGLAPLAVVHPSSETEAGSGEDFLENREEIEGVPVLHGTELAPHLISTYQIPYVLISRPDLEHRALSGVVRRCSQLCEHVFVASGTADTPALWTSGQAFQGFLGYGVRHVDRSRAIQLGKRVFDILGALIALVLLAPVFLGIAALTKLDSSGPIFFRQLRIGKRGRCFPLLKFRSMYVNADARLESVLQEDDELRAEYEKYHKLRKDPRVTCLGRVLRRYSLDELPQLWNVLKGDMSLIGPRAYTPNELSDMQGLDRVILQGRPGLSGLWQVSGRNALSFAERTRMDVHYIHHWTPWLDLYILARTLPAVLEEGKTA